MAPNDLSVGGKNGPGAGNHQALGGAENTPKHRLGEMSTSLDNFNDFFTRGNVSFN